MSKDQIKVQPRTIKIILNETKYTVDDYQRTYNWQKKEVADLVEDLSKKFLESYKEDHDRSAVANYPHYFMGSIIISEGSGEKLIVDGQQRLISLTLFLIYLNNLQKEQGREDKVTVDSLIFSETFGKKSFNIDIPGVTEQISHLYYQKEPGNYAKTNSVRSILERFSDIEEIFPDELKGEALPYFIDWLKENVDLVEITTHSDKEAYVIFETMNDRGLNLTSIDKLKSYLLSNIDNSTERSEANTTWRNRIFELKEEEGTETLFFTAWLSAKYVNWQVPADEREIENELVDNIRSQPDRWVRENYQAIGLRKSQHFSDFIKKQLNFFINPYLQISKATKKFDPTLETVYYVLRSDFPNSSISTNFFDSLFISPLCINDSKDVLDRKIRLVASFIEIIHVLRIVNPIKPPLPDIKIPRKLSYLSYGLVKDIREMDIQTLASYLKGKIISTSLNFENLKSLALGVNVNSSFIRYLLARMTSHIERQAGIESSFTKYFDRHGDTRPFEIEHIWANRYEQHSNKFRNKKDFDIQRNNIGGLVLLPNGINQSLNDAPFETKIDVYYGQNLLTKSLNERCYQSDPAFKSYVKRSNIPFRGYTEFTQASFDERALVYRKICEEIWDLTVFDKEIQA